MLHLPWHVRPALLGQPILTSFTFMTSHCLMKAIQAALAFCGQQQERRDSRQSIKQCTLISTGCWLARAQLPVLICAVVSCWWLGHGSIWQPDLLEADLLQHMQFCPPMQNVFALEVCHLLATYCASCCCCKHAKAAPAASQLPGVPHSLTCISALLIQHQP